MPYNILHLSDIHIGNQSLDLTHLSALIEQALIESEQEIHQIVITGDIFNHDSQEIKKAASFFEEIRKNINGNQSTKLDRTDILFVPGNHEINKEIVNGGGKLEDSFEKYKDFLKKFYDVEDLPRFFVNDNLNVFKCIDEKKIIFIGINSAHYVDTGHTYGYFNQKDFTDIQKNLIKLNDLSYKLVLFMHHQFYQFQEQSKEEIDNSSLRNADAFLSNFEKYNVKAILHGHRHENIVKRININNNHNKKDKMVTVIGCGSTNKSDVPVTNFNIVKICSENSGKDLDVVAFERKGQYNFRSVLDASFPVEEDYLIKSDLENMLKLDDDLYTIFEEISSKGSHGNYIDLLDKTIGQSPESNHILNSNKKALLLMLLLAHHRFSDTSSDFLFKKIKEKTEGLYSEEVKNYFIKILSAKTLYDLKDSDIRVDVFCNRYDKQSAIFSLISFFISDFYLTLTKKADAFFEIAIKRKTNFNVSSKTEIIDGINNNRLTIEFNEDKRAINIDVQCTKAISHKVIKLIINEYELLLAKFESIFSEVKFKLYYLSNKVTSSTSEIQNLKSYTFTAYMKTLLNLLAGQHIYSTKLVFIRELIQNSIDAINLRKKIDENFQTERGKIDIKIKKEGKNNIIEVSDNGAGMTKYHIERYLTTVGRSYYKSDEFDIITNENKYTPISQFGIGFLSAFNISEEIKVYTKYFDDELEQQASFLEIPNIDGCFFINDYNKTDIGTTINLNTTNTKYISSGELEKYIESNIIQCSYDIYFNDKLLVKNNDLENNIENITQNFNLYFKIPLDENGNTEFGKSESKYAIYIYKDDKSIFNDQQQMTLSEGITVRNFSLPEKIEQLQKKYFNIILSLPPNALELEVSRDFVKNYKLSINEETVSFIETLINKYFNEGTYKNLPLSIAAKINPDYDTLSNIFIGYDKAERSLTLKSKNDNNVETFTGVLNIICNKNFANHNEINTISEEEIIIIKDTYLKLKSCSSVFFDNFVDIFFDTTQEEIKYIESINSQQDGNEVELDYSTIYEKSVKNINKTMTDDFHLCLAIEISTFIISFSFKNKIQHKDITNEFETAELKNIIFDLIQTKINNIASDRIKHKSKYEKTNTSISFHLRYMINKFISKPENILKITTVDMFKNIYIYSACITYLHLLYKSEGKIDEQNLFIEILSTGISSMFKYSDVLNSLLIFDTHCLENAQNTLSTLFDKVSSTAKNIYDDPSRN